MSTMNRSAVELRPAANVRARSVVIDDRFPVRGERRPGQVVIGIGRDVDQVRKLLLADVEVHHGERVPHVLVLVDKREVLAVRREGGRSALRDRAVPPGRRDLRAGLGVVEARRRGEGAQVGGRRHEQAAIRVEAAVGERAVGPHVHDGGVVRHVVAGACIERGIGDEGRAVGAGAVADIAATRLEHGRLRVADLDLHDPDRARPRGSCTSRGTRSRSSRPGAMVHDSLIGPVTLPAALSVTSTSMGSVPRAAAAMASHDFWGTPNAIGLCVTLK